jgi:hypothetical protein
VQHELSLLAALHGNCLQFLNVPEVSMRWLGVSGSYNSKICSIGGAALIVFAGSPARQLLDLLRGAGINRGKIAPQQCFEVHGTMGSDSPPKAYSSSPAAAAAAANSNCDCSCALAQ